MKISLDWLKDYIDIDHSAEEISGILSDLGFPVEDIDYLDKDIVLDVEVTSNRADCLSHIGVARELAAATGKELKLPEITYPEVDKKADTLVAVRIDEPEMCGRYTARVIEGIKIGPSPDWMKNRLEAIGVRSVNNVVDATNYAMMETGQPPHAFDYDKIPSHKIIVRKAKQGESIVSIDETNCKLEESMLVIADDNIPVAVAGVMGGLDTEISDSSTKVLLEDAHFSPVCIRSTSRALVLSSESSFRFERNVDIAMIDWASRRTAQLITMVAGGKVAKGVVDEFPKGYEAETVSMRLSRMNKLLGIEVAAEDVMDIFAKLGLNPKKTGDDVIECMIPTWRVGDLVREVDLIEEVIRVYGYNKIPTETKINIEVAAINPEQKFQNEVAEFLNSCGCFETISVTFTDDVLAKLFTDGDMDTYLAVKDVSRKNANLLRQTLLGSLMTVFKSNYNAGNTGCKFYEIADTFIKKGDKHDESTKLSLLFDSDLRELRGVVEALMKKIDRDIGLTFEPCDVKWAKAAAKISANKKEVGLIAIVSSDTCNQIDIKGAEPVVAELDMGVLYELQSGPVKIKHIPRFPAIVRDLSIIVDEKTLWADIYAAIDEKKTSQLEAVKFVDIYRGKPIEKGKKSVTLSLKFRDDDGTLTHEQVDEFEKKMVDNLTQKLSAELRQV